MIHMKKYLNLYIKAVVSVPTHLGADIIRKYLEPDYNEQNLANADHILYRIAAREYDFYTVI